jgi:hypothetical protein
LRETLVKFEISFADIGNYDDVDVPGILPGWAAPVVALWGRGTARLERRKTGAKETSDAVQATIRAFAEITRRRGHDLLTNKNRIVRGGVALRDRMNGARSPLNVHLR